MLEILFAPLGGYVGKYFCHAGDYVCLLGITLGGHRHVGNCVRGCWPLGDHVLIRIMFFASRTAPWSIIQPIADRNSYAAKPRIPNEHPCRTRVTGGRRFKGQSMTNCNNSNKFTLRTWEGITLKQDHQAWQWPLIKSTGHKHTTSHIARGGEERHPCWPQQNKAMTANKQRGAEGGLCHLPQPTENHQSTHPKTLLYSTS